MENVNTPQDFDLHEFFDLDSSDDNFTCNSHKVWKMPSEEDLSEISDAAASLTISTASSFHGLERTNLNSSNCYSENVDISLKQTLNFKEVAVRRAGFTHHQLTDVSHFTSCNASAEGRSTNVLFSEAKPSTSEEQRFAFRSLDGSEFNQTHHSDRHKSTECQSSLQKRLMQAISQNKLGIVRDLLLVDKLDPNFTLAEDMHIMKNPICHATTLGNIQALKLLLDAGAHPDTPNESDLLWKRHPIHIAASRGDLSAIKLLTQRGAIINQCDNDKRTPLHWVAIFGQADVVTWMLDAGAEVNSTQADGFTPLHTATCLGNREVCRLLINGGANLCYKDGDGWTPLHTAVCYGYIEIITLLLDKGACPLVTTSMNEDTTLHLACTKGRWDIAELMLKKGVPIESRNSHGFTPLLTAVFYNRVELAFHLVKRGADVNAVNNAGTNPIYLSAVRCELDLIKLLMSAGCKVPRHLSTMSLTVSQHSQTLAAEMEYRSSSPQMLRENCLVVIRQSLAPGLQINAFLLPLPKVIIRELVMNDIFATEISLFS